MSISKHKETRFVVECDNCGIKSHHSYEAPTDPADTYASVLARGWYSDELLDLCASCDHKNTLHWRQHVDAMDAAAVAAEGALFVARWVVYRCEQCGLWTYRTEEFRG